MAELEPCRVCGAFPQFASRLDSTDENVVYAVWHKCEGPFERGRLAAAAEWNAAQRSPDLAAIRAAVEAERVAAHECQTEYAIWHIARASGTSGVSTEALTRAERDYADRCAALDALLGGGE